MGSYNLFEIEKLSISPEQEINVQLALVRYIYRTTAHFKYPVHDKRPKHRFIIATSKTRCATT